MSIIDPEHVIDIEKQIERLKHADKAEISEEVKEQKEAIRAQELEGFLATMKKVRDADGIQLDYDVEEVKEILNNRINHQKG